MLIVLFQHVPGVYEGDGWTFHHEQQLDFKEPAADSSPAITLCFDDKSSDDDKWEVDSLGPPKVRSSLSQVHWYCSTVQYIFASIRL